MNALRKFLVTVFGLCLAVALSILVLIHGWGLEPKSWWWIIGVGVFGQIMAQLIARVGLAKEE